VPTGSDKFQRVELKGDEMLPVEMQTILSGIAPGQPVVANAPESQNSVEQ
jgi:hypothetical protein